MFEQKPTPTTSSQVSRLSSVVVWTVWAILALALLAYVWEHGRNMPFQDDIIYIPAVTWYQPVTPEWLWSRINEHLIPVQRLVLVGLLKAAKKLTGTLDFRAILYFNALLPIGLSFALIRTAARLRGHTSLADLFFPFVLLNWGNGQLVLWSSMIVLGLPAALTGVLLLYVRLGRHVSPVGVLLLCLVVLLLALSGAVGAAYLPAAVLWLVYLAGGAWRSGSKFARTTSLLLGGTVLLVGMLTLRFFQGIEKSALAQVSPTVGSLLSNLVQFLTMPLTSHPATFWPFSGVVVLAAYLGAVTVTVRACLRGDDTERPHAWGLLAFLGGSLCLALGLAHGRGESYGGLLAHAAGIHQYVFTATPGLCAVYLAWLSYGPSPSRVVVPWCFALAALVALPMQMWDGLAYGQQKRDELNAAELDLLAGEPLYVLLARHGRFLCPHITDHENLAYAFRFLRDSGGGAFAHLRENPPLTESPLDVTPNVLHEVDWDGRTARGADSEAFFEYHLPRPRYLVGIRLRYRVSNPRPTYFQMTWRRHENEEFPDTIPFQYLRRLEGEGTMLIYIAERVQHLRVHPDLVPFEFQIEEITLLTTAPLGKQGVAEKTPGH